MFTGIIESLGRIAGLEPRGGDMRLRIHAPGIPWQDTGIGESIAVNGVCLTAVLVEDQGFAADVSRESLQVTTLGTLHVGDSVNLERALTLSSRLGGHLVSGHVDGVGEVVGLRQDARSIRVYIQAPEGLLRYIAAKGSITIDGTSLTVNGVEGACFDVNIVPHTWEKTRFSVYQNGSKVNLEVDIIARYLEKLLAGTHSAPNLLGSSRITEEWLAENGFSNNQAQNK